jgi:RNA polymerase sigma factor (sigma-70 family)
MADGVFLAMTIEQDRRIADAVRRERPRLFNFIRRRVADEGDAEDILQDVFHEFVAASRLMRPVEQVGAWLFRVARNRIVDRFRRGRSESRGAIEDEDALRWEDLLPSREAGPQAAFARRVLAEELDAALEELTPEQREAFVAHEIEGRSFREISAATGVPVNTLLSRKHAAVLHLRERLEDIYDEFRESPGEER